MYVEDRIIAARQQSVEIPFGWLVCFESRPLQGIPPKANGAHILFFSNEETARSFISDRVKFFEVEPLSTLSIDSPGTLKLMALDPSNDIRYGAPPCGIVFDFNYATGKSRKVLTPADVNRMLPVEIASAFGFKTSRIVDPAIEPSKPQIKTEPKPQSSRKRPLVTVLVACGSLLLVGLLFLCIGGIWFGMSRGAIPGLPFLYTPTSSLTLTPTPRPTLTPTPTSTPRPTITLTPTPSPLAWDLNLVDNFETNTYSWPLSSGNPASTCGSSNLTMQDNSLILKINSAADCDWWYWPNIPAVTDFDLSVDMRRSGATGNTVGLIFRYVDSAKSSSYSILIDDAYQLYYVALDDQGNSTALVNWQYDSNIIAGGNNRIGISARGSQFTIFINGVKVNTIDDNTLAAGTIGIIAGVYNAGDQDTIIYKNFELQANLK
jgi:hypothetical protein